MGTLLLGAVGVLGELQNTLTLIWHVQPKAGRRLLSWLPGQLITLLIVLGVALFALIIHHQREYCRIYAIHHRPSPWHRLVFAVDGHFYFLRDGDTHVCRDVQSRPGGSYCMA